MASQHHCIHKALQAYLSDGRARFDPAHKCTPAAVLTHLKDHQLEHLTPHALAFEEEWGGLEVEGLRLGLGWDHPTFARSRAGVALGIGCAPYDTAWWMIEGGLCVEDPDIELALPIAADGESLLNVWLPGGAMTPWSPLRHQYIAQIEGLQPAALANVLQRPVGGLAFGPTLAIWSTSTSKAYNILNAFPSTGDQSATLSGLETSDWLAALDLIASRYPDSTLRLDQPDYGPHHQPSGRVLWRLSAYHPRLSERAGWLERRICDDPFPLRWVRL